MERDTNQKENPNDTAPEYEQNGKHFIEDKEEKPGDGLLFHGRPLSEMEIEELRVHQENNRFLGISDTPEVGTGGGNAGGVVPDKEDLEKLSDKLTDNSLRDSNFGRNYNGGNQSQDHFVEVNSGHEHKKEK